MKEVFQPTVILKPEVVSIGSGTRIDSFCKLEGGHWLTIGDYVHVASFCHLNIGGGTLRIGNHCFFASGSRIVTGGNKTWGQSMSAVSPKEMQALEWGEVVIKDYAGMLTGAIVLPGVTLHEGAVAAAGSVVTKDIPAWEIWAGVPAKFLAKREVTTPIDEDWAQRDADLRACARG